MYKQHIYREQNIYIQYIYRNQFDKQGIKIMQITNHITLLN